MLTGEEAEKEPLGEKRSHSCRRSQGEMGTSSTSFRGGEQVSEG